MVADVAVGDGAQNGVRQGVQARIGVGMADQSLVMWNLNPAQPDGGARPPAVDVIALTDAGDGAGGGQGLGHGEILWIGQFHQARIARDQSDTAARALDHGGLVGGGFIGGPDGIGVADGLQAEGLRGLGAPQVLAIYGADDHVLIASAQAVRDRQGGQGAVGAFQTGQKARDHLRAQKGTGGVVDQHRLFIGAGQG